MSSRGSERLVDASPWGHWKTGTFVAGLRADGLIAPFVIGGAMDGLAFRAYVERVLAPELRKGDVVVMDNLPAHKVAGICEAIRAAGVGVLYLPPYSPDLNPIRAGLRQAESTSPQGRRQDQGRPLRHPRHPAHRFQPKRLPELSHNLGL